MEEFMTNTLHCRGQSYFSFFWGGGKIVSGVQRGGKTFDDRPLQIGGPLPLKMIAPWYMMQCSKGNMEKLISNVDKDLWHLT